MARYLCIDVMNILIRCKLRCNLLFIVWFNNDVFLEMVTNRFAAPLVSGLFTLGWMRPVKREQVRREWKSELQHVILL